MSIGYRFPTLAEKGLSNHLKEFGIEYDLFVNEVTEQLIVNKKVNKAFLARKFNVQPRTIGHWLKQLKAEKHDLFA